MSSLLILQEELHNARDSATEEHNETGNALVFHGVQVLDRPSRVDLELFAEEENTVEGNNAEHFKEKEKRTRWRKECENKKDNFCNEVEATSRIQAIHKFL